HSAGSSDTCYSRRTRKASAAFASHEENWFVFSRSHRPPLTRTGKAIYGRILYYFIQLKNSVIGKRYTSSPYTRRLLEKETHFFCVRCFSRKLSLSCGRKGLGGTPECVSTRRPTSRPRKA